MTVQEIFKTPIFLAPMAGVTDSSFRIIVRELTENEIDKKNLLMFSEMISSAGIFFRNEKTLDMLKVLPEEKPLAIQLFGSDVKMCSESAKFVEEFSNADVIDFNMGCPVLKVIKNNEGSALMKNPKLAGEILSAIKKSVSLPVSVKIRLGFDTEHINSVEIAKIAESSGVDFITVHGRTRDQFYFGKADWEEIVKVKSAIKIPVIANGDIKDYESMDKVFTVTKADGVMIGRAVQGNPWLINNLLKYFRTGEKTALPTISERAEIMSKHFAKLLEFKGEYIAVREMRSHAAWYTKGMQGGANLRNKFNCAESAEEFFNIISDFFH